jgi:glycosyl hydrolase family 26
MARSQAIIKSYGGLVIPASGIYMGAEDADTDRNFTNAKGIETQMGRRMAIRRQHYAWLTAYPTAFERNNVALTNPKVIPMICQAGYGNFPVKATGAWGSTNTATVNGARGMDRITAGEFDSFFTSCATNMLALGVPILYNLFFEYNGQHNNYYAAAQGGVGTGGETTFKNAWIHIWNLFDAVGATLNHANGNVIFVWCAQGPTTAGDYKNYYAGDQYVDMVGLDLYRATFASRATNPGAYNGGTGSQDYYLFAQTHSKPFIICEGGLRDSQSIPDVAGAGGDGLNYDKDGNGGTGRSAINKLLADLKSHPDCVAYVHWNELGDTTLSGTGNYVDTTPAALTQYRAMYNDPYCGLFYQGTVQPPPGQNPVNTTPPTLSDTSPQVGQVLTALPGVWDNGPVTRAYQWQRDGTNIAGAASETYACVSADQGHALTVIETATNTHGATSQASAPSQSVVATGTGGTISGTPDPHMPGFYDANFNSADNTQKQYGRVRGHAAMLELNGVIYVCNKGPAPHVVDNSGASPVDRTDHFRLTAWKKSTGALITTWAPNPDGDVMGIVPNAAGTKVMVVGGFNNIAGVSRPTVAVLNALSSESDTTAASAQQAAISGMSGTAWHAILDEANNRAWVCGSFGVKKFSLSAGVWSVDSGFNAGISPGTGSAMRAMTLKPDGTKLAVCGDTAPWVTALNPTTGAAMTWGYAPTGAPGYFDIDSDANGVYIAGGATSISNGDQSVYVDWNGAGPNNISGIGNCYWYVWDDGNCQALRLITIAGSPYLAVGHHGDIGSTSINQHGTTQPNQTRHGLIVHPATVAGGDLNAFGNPPAFSRQNSTTATPLKLFSIYQGPTGDLYCGGDFDTVGGVKFQRFARFPATGGSGTPYNTGIPTIDIQSPIVGQVVNGTNAPYANSPTSVARQWYRVDSSGAAAAIPGATAAAYTVTSADAGFQLMFVNPSATNASGVGSPAWSLPTNPVAVPSGGTPAAPVIDNASKPPNPDTLITDTFTWTDTDVVDHYRWRVTVDGVAGNWTITTTPNATVSVPAGHTYKFEVQAGDLNNNYSGSDSYTWSVSSSLTVDPPVITFAPTASSGGTTGSQSAGFLWTENNEDSGYRYQTLLDTPSGPGAVYSPPQTAKAFSLLGPLAAGTYTLHVRAVNAGGSNSPDTTWTWTVTPPSSGPHSPQLSVVPTNPTTDDTPDFTFA